MNPVSLTIEIRGIDEAEHTLQAVRSAIANRGPLHAELAVNALQMTQAYLRGLNRHRTAVQLKAVPTGFHEKSAARLQAESDDEAAILRIPRNTGLGQAFGDVVINPTNGRKFLTIPACAETYGRQAGEFPEDTFDFAVILTKRGPATVFLWAKTEGQHAKGEVAFWLRRSVTKKHDPTLLPSNDSYRELGRRTCVAYIANLVYRQPA
jgi:hypothetical protein